MDVDEVLKRLFLERLESLEQFRITYSGRNPDLPLRHGDQDIQRLLEAQAFFSARTQRITERTLSRSLCRLFGQHFPFLLAPLPALAMVGAQMDARFVDPVVLPDGESMALQPAQTVGGEQESGLLVHLRTLRGLPLRPLRLESVVLERDGGSRRGGELLLTLDAIHPRRWPVGQLSLYIDHLGDLGSSVAVFHALTESLIGAEVFFGVGATASRTRSRCPVAFGPPTEPNRKGAVVDHPLQLARSFFRLPQQDLFLTFDVPEPLFEWDVLTLCLHLSESWPRALSLTPETFRLHVVPAINLRRELAAPVEVDGTRDAYPIVHPDALGGYRPHSIQGVYRLDATQGLVPLPPGFVPEMPSRDRDRPSSWEAELEGLAEARRGQLRVTAPSAFEAPMRVAVDAHWHQPSCAADVVEGSPARLLERHLDGVAFSTLGPALPSAEADLGDDPDGLLALLAARGQRVLGLAELRVLLGVLRGPAKGAFDDVVRALAAVDVRAVPSALAPGGFRYNYVLRFEGLGAGDLPLLHLLARRLRQVLEAWSTEDVVGLSIHVPELRASVHFRDEAWWR